MTSGDVDDPVAEARADVVGSRITGIFYLDGFIEVHIGDVILTGMTKPFGVIGCQGVGPLSMTSLIGKAVEELTVVEGEYLAIDSGENRLAFPIGGPTANGPASVVLVRRAHAELEVETATWTW